jgi:hypothetical protein
MWCQIESENFTIDNDRFAWYRDVKKTIELADEETTPNCWKVLLVNCKTTANPLNQVNIHSRIFWKQFEIGRHGWLYNIERKKSFTVLTFYTHFNIPFLFCAGISKWLEDPEPLRNGWMKNPPRTSKTQTHWYKSFQSSMILYSAPSVY